ncbi:MAG: RDD family protein [bacterium]|nr:RDD family protein [bacterium]
MDRTLEVRTPESIAFSYELAGLGTRFLAIAIDLCIQIGIVIAVAFGFYEIGVHASKGSHANDDAASNLAIALVVVLVFLIFFGYFIIFEALWHGRTPGKRLLGIRVVRDGGYPLDFTAALVRNLIRVGEFSLGFYAISIVAALLSRENKRVGDLAAGTIVVRDARMDVEVSSLRELANEPVYAATAYVTGEERALIKRFLDRRDALLPERRTALAASIAERIRPRLPADLQRLDDEDLLERL